MSVKRILQRGGVVAVVLSVTLALVGFIGPITAGAVTALIMGGTAQPYPNQVPGYIDAVSQRYVDPVSPCKYATCTLQSVYTPEQFSPIFTTGMTFNQSANAGVPLLDAAIRAALNQPEDPANPSGPPQKVVVFGYSQSATVATEEQLLLAADPSIDKSQLEFVLIGDPNRPNGGFLQRFFPVTIPIFDYRPTNASVNNTGIARVDISFQYDIAADLPKYPLDLFALVNTILGNSIHGSYPNSMDGYTSAELLAAIDDPANREVVGDTTYITLPTKQLPLAQAIRDVGYTTSLSAIFTPLADLLEPTLRVLVELGYDRSASYGSQQSFGLIPNANPVKVLGDLAVAAVQGINNLLADLGVQPPTTNPGGFPPIATPVAAVARPQPTAAVAVRTLTPPAPASALSVNQPRVQRMLRASDGTDTTSLPAVTGTSLDQQRSARIGRAGALGITKLHNTSGPAVQPGARLHAGAKAHD
jgi:hypothetical protein